MIGTLKNSVWGCVEMGIFMMKESITRFDDSPRSMRSSFWVPFFALFVITLGLYNFRDPSQWPMFLALFIVGAFFASIKYAAFLYLVRLWARSVKRSEYYRKFIVMNNWLFLVQTISFLPVFLSNAYGDPEKSVSYMLIGIMYSYMVLLFMSSRLFDIKPSDAVMVPLASVVVNVAVMVIFGKMGGMVIL